VIGIQAIKMQKLKKSLAIGITALLLVTAILPYANASLIQKERIKSTEISESEENYGPP
jgi:hypothetical protein